jgi:hypothetical protein
MDLRRAGIATALAIATGIFGFTIGMGLSVSWPIAAVGALIAGAGIGAWFYARPFVPLDPAPWPRSLVILSAIATLGALVLYSRIAVFMVHSELPAYSLVPNSTFEVEHSCATAYFVAARAASTSPDVYADSLYTARDDDPTKIRKPLKLGPFRIDVFEYPPPFLLLPRALRLLAPEFMAFRTLWFGICGAFMLAAMIAVAGMLGPVAGTRALLLLPLAWLTLPMASSMQKGNVHGVVIAASMLAMVLFDRRRWAAGGALLAFATVSKLYPGLLVLYLLTRREWRPVAWTAVLGALFVLAATLDLGTGMFAVFAHHLPGLMSGEAFPAFRNPSATAINFSIPGLIFKLKLFGVPGMGFEAAKLVGWAWTLVAAATTVILAQRARSPEERPLVWLAVLILATLRSPFLPEAYAAIPALWLLTLAASRFVPNAGTLAWVVAGWTVLGMMIPLDWGIDPRALALLMALPQAATIALAVWIARRSMQAEALAGSGGTR